MTTQPAHSEAAGDNAAGPPRKRRFLWPPLVLPLLAAVTVTLFETVLLQRKQAIFTGEYLRPSHLQGLDVPLFLLGSLLLDATLVAPVAWLADAVLRRGRRVNPSQRVLLAWGLACIPLGIASFARFQITQFLGDTIEFSLLHTLTGGSYATMFSVASTYLIGLAYMLLPLLAVFGAALLALGRWPLRRAERWAAGRTETLRGCAAGAGLLLAASMGLLVAVSQGRPAVFGPLCSKVSGYLLAEAANQATDFDRDGYGLVLEPRDHAPFDAGRYPYALDLPGNGIDENGVGGDLPSRGRFDDERYGPVAFAQKPDLVIFVLESFRRDNVGAREDGRPVTPVLERLVAEGAVLGDGYSPSAFTVGALEHLFLGGLSLTQKDSLIDDFHANGYLTAVISGQNETFGNIDRATGMRRADYYADATSHDDERTYVFSPQGVLLVPWTTVQRDIRTFLAAHGAGPRPIFLYINLQDCHFPYHHYGMKPLVASDPVTRSEIRPDQADRVRRTYRNAAANVDMAVGEILAEITRARGRKPAFVIVGDHGECLFDHGLLGHGVAMVEEAHRIPVLVGGMPAECVFPMGLAELRRMIREALSRPPGPPRARTDPKKTVFLYIGSLDAPASVGVADETSAVSFNFRTWQPGGWGPPHPWLDSGATLRFWEQLALYQHESRAGPPAGAVAAPAINSESEEVSP